LSTTGSIGFCLILASFWIFYIWLWTGWILDVLPISKSSTVHSTRLHVVSWRNFYPGLITYITCRNKAASVPIPVINSHLKLFPRTVTRHNPFYDCQYPIVTRRAQITTEKTLALFGIFSFQVSVMIYYQLGHFGWRMNKLWTILLIYSHYEQLWENGAVWNVGQFCFW
jgi:hypothetical protein